MARDIEADKAYKRAHFQRNKERYARLRRERRAAEQSDPEHVARLRERRKAYREERIRAGLRVFKEKHGAEETAPVAPEEARELREKWFARYGVEPKVRSR